MAIRNIHLLGSMDPVPFNKPFIVGKELSYIAEAVVRGNIGGDGYFTKACAKLLEDRFGIEKVLMTPSCTASLEMAAQLCPQHRLVLSILPPEFNFGIALNAQRMQRLLSRRTPLNWR